ncbi:threonine synthase-like 1 [Saccoglossus kowalevskii]
MVLLMNVWCRSVASSFGLHASRSCRTKLQRVTSPTASVSAYTSVNRLFCTNLRYKRDNNVILIGCPGSGKTTVGKILSTHLAMSVLDFDNDILEPYWEMAVGDKLSQVGADKFLQLEGDVLLQFQQQNHIISLSGSNPLHHTAMKHISNSGIVVFLDVHINDIIARMAEMKVDRIVGQGKGVHMEDILKYRLQFYEKWYDLRVICARKDSPEIVAEKIMKGLKRYHTMRNHISTRSSSSKSATVNTEEGHKNFLQVVREGLASDGGLYIPQTNIPYLHADQWSRLIGCSYQEKALRILEQWIHPEDVHPQKLRSMIDKGYKMDNFNCQNVIPLVHLRNNQYLLELFHGPTASFKDAALQLMPQFFTEAVKRCDNNARYLVLVATSGDTGSAVLDGFSKYSGDSGTLVMVLFPENGVSLVQKTQMRATLGDNVHVVGIKGDFDFCQTSIKSIFNNIELCNQLLDQYNIKLSAANSINWGRLLPQVVYHASAYLNLVNDDIIKMSDPIDLCIPTGNFGNMLAAVYAKAMGIPIRRLICASNSNNVLTDFFKTGVYDLRSRNLQTSMSPAIDILKSSNLERFLYFITDGDGDTVRSYYAQLETKKYFTVSKEILNKIQSEFIADWCNEEECATTISSVFKEEGYLMDPHTAVGKTVADRHNNEDCPMVIASTAHYAKFATEVLQCIGLDTPSDDPIRLFKQLAALNPRPGMHQELNNALHKPVHHSGVIDGNLNDVVSEIIRFIKIIS